MSYISELHSLNGCCMGFLFTIIFFGKVLVFNFWNLFLRTLKDFYSYHLIEYVIGYIGRVGFFTFTYSMGFLYEGGFLFTIFFWKGSRILFWNLFLRTLNDF